MRENWPRLLGAVLAVAFLLGNQGLRSLVRNYRELLTLRREISRLEAEEARLNGRLKALRSGDSALERLARRELGFVKKGEIEYRFPPPPGAGG